ncbi:MAG: cupredoxin domain-containing protein [Actinobacteria bacterium]|nr:cupredoxin domain-containing protein [Actinomycetota bacterium]
MLTQPAKVFLPLTVVGVVAAVAYSGMTGDHTGIALLFGLALVAFGAAVAVTVHRDNQVAPVPAEDAGPPELRPAPAVRLPGGPGWPALAGVAAALFALSFVIAGGLAVAGAVLALVAAVGWLASASSDRTGRTPNLMPIGIPVVGLFAIASLMFLMSRILLAVPERASTFIALIVASVILGLASFVALKPNISSRAVMTGLVIAGLLMTSGGILAAVAGQRDIEVHGGEHGETAVSIEAEDIKFNLTEIDLHADQPSVIEFDNKEAQPHNVAIYPTEEAADVIFQGDVVVGPITTEYRFTAPPAGTYFFRCDIHPAMKGSVKVA